MVLSVLALWHNFAQQMPGEFFPAGMNRPLKPPSASPWSFPKIELLSAIWLGVSFKNINVPNLIISAFYCSLWSLTNCARQMWTSESLNSIKLPSCRRILLPWSSERFQIISLYLSFQFNRNIFLVRLRRGNFRRRCCGPRLYTGREKEARPV